MTGRARAIGVAEIALSAGAWGTWSLFLRPTELGPEVTGPIVFAVMFAGCFLFLRLDPTRPRWDRATVLLLLGSGVLDAINVLTFFGAMTHTSVAIAVLTHYLAPVLIALAAPVVDGVRVPGAPAAAVAATAGLVLVLAPWEADAGNLTGALLGATSAFAYAGNVFVSRRLAVRLGPVRAMGYHAGVSALLLAPFALGSLASVSASDLGLLVAGGFVVGLLTGIAFNDGLRRVDASLVAVLTFLEPLVAVLVGILAWDEPLRGSAVAGGAVILGAGIWLTTRPTA